MSKFRMYVRLLAATQNKYFFNFIQRTKKVSLS